MPEPDVREFTGSVQLISLATVGEDGRPRVRYVAGRADDDLVVRFSTHLDSDKVAQIRADPRVCLVLGATDVRSRRWLQVEGTATVTTAPQELREFWFPELGAHFTGPDDPRYSLVVITPTLVTLGRAS